MAIISISGIGEKKTVLLWQMHIQRYLSPVTANTMIADCFTLDGEGQQ